jgi:hypothetical protein
MNACCEQPENRSEREQVEGKADLTVTRCTICGRRHFEITVDPGQVGLKVASLSGGD